MHFRPFSWHLIAGIFFIFCAGSLSAQTDTTLRFSCGTTAGYIALFGRDTAHSHGSNIITNTVPQTSFDPLAIQACGKFRIYYEDLLSANPAAGFSDPVYGAARRNTLCAVLTYIQSVFDFRNIPSSDPICLYVIKSYAQTPAASNAPSSVTFYGEGAPNFIIPGGGGIVNGYVNYYMQTGLNPSPGGYHAELLMNFDGMNNSLGVKIPFKYQNDYTLPMVNCNMDLFSALLHECTHILGWISLIDYPPVTPYLNNLVPSPTYPNVFSGLDTSIYVGTVYPATSLTRLVNSGFTINPGTNASNNYWINNKPAPDNYPVFSGRAAFPGINTPFTNLTGTPYLLHMDDQYGSYTLRQHISPGDNEEYVMGPYGMPGRLTRTYSKAELQSIPAVLNINLDSTFRATHPNILGNHPAFSKKMAGYTMYDSALSFTETVAADYVIANNGGSVVINVNADPLLTDADGDSISVMPGTLINFRGCGSGGNNHTQLSLSNGNKTVTYTPRANFMGRAQFGFNIWDGKEKGSFVYYTIDVTKGSAVTYTPGSNMVLNGNFEEGTEVRTSVYDTIPNSTQEWTGNREGKLNGIHFSDSHPYNFYSNSSYPGGSGILVHNSLINCNGTSYKGYAGYNVVTWPDILGSSECPAVAAGGSGERYQTIGLGVYGFYRLISPAKSCARYTLEFDAAIRSRYTSVNLPLEFILADTLNLVVNYAPVPKFTIDTAFTLTPGWQHITLSFWYCGAGDSAKLLSIRIRDTNSYHNLFIDNISLKQDLTPPALSATIAATRFTSCLTQLVTTVTNASCAVTHRWSNGATTASITVSSNTTATYRDTVSDGCRIYVVSSTVTAAVPGASVSGGSTSLCPGQTTTLTASPSTAGLIFQWYNGGTAISGATASAYTANAAGTYSVNIRDGYTCNATSAGGSVTYNPKPAATITQGSSVSICVGNTLTLNAATAAGQSYVWYKNGAVPSGATSAAYTESGLGVGTYTYKVVVTNSSGCSDTATISVTVTSSSCGPGCIFSGLSYTTPSSITSSITGTPSTRNYYIASNLTIGTGSTATIDLSGLIVFVAPGVTINIAANTTLILDSCHFFSCTGNRWAGFAMGSGSRITTRNYTLIEAADVAITVNSASQSISIDNTTFNRNLTGITMTGITNPTTANYVVQNSIFTCRDFSVYAGYPYSWPTTQALKTIVSRSNPNDAPYVIDRDYTTTTVPNAGLALNTGVNIGNCGKTTASSGVYTFTEIQVGGAAAASRCLFDNVSHGIWVDNSNCGAVNNVFIGNDIGIRVLTNALNASEKRIRAYMPSGSNTSDFYGCRFGMEIDDCAFVTASNLKMYNSARRAGGYGIQQQGRSYHNVNVSNNYFYNLQHGVSLSFGGMVFSTTTATMNSDMSISVAGNQMLMVDSAISLSNAFSCMYCLRVTGTAPYGTVSISSNTIAQAYNGIVMNGISFPNTNVSSNQVTLLDQPGAAQYGIKAIGAWLNVNNDSVSRFNTNAPGKNDLMRGYYIAASPGSYIGCNKEAYTGRGFEFEGNNPGLRWLSNSMYENNKGLVVSTGLIGRQYYLSTNPSGNKWATFPTNINAWKPSFGYQTYTQNRAKASNSPLYINGSNLAIEKPSNNFGQYQGPGYLYSDTFLISVVGSSECAPTNHNGNVSYIVIAQNGVPFAENQAINIWKAQFAIYQTLVYDPSLMDTSAILQDFYAQAATSRYGLLTRIESYLVSGHTDSAQALIDGGMTALTPTGPDGYGVEVMDYTDVDNIVANYLTLYQAGIHYMDNNVTAIDADNLLSLVNLCPMTAGDVVYQARSLYNLFYYDAPFWNDDACIPAPVGGKYANPNGVKAINAKGGNQDYSLFPNPGNGKITITQKVADDKPVKVTVLNSAGQSVYQGNLQFDTRTVKLNLANQVPGLYLLHLIDANGNDYVLNFIINE